MDFWFTKRGKIFSRGQVRTHQTAPKGLFFMGDVDCLELVGFELLKINDDDTVLLSNHL